MPTPPGGITMKKGVKNLVSRALLRIVVMTLVAAMLIGIPGVFHLSLAARTAFAASGVTRFFVYFPLYLQTGICVYPVEYFVPATSAPARAAIEALIAGLPDKGGMMVVSLPKETRVRGISIRDGTCTVDFSGDIRRSSVGSGGEAALIESIVRTLCQFQTVDSVRIMIEGEPAESLAGHVDISGPLKPSSREGVVFVTFPDARVHWGGGVISILQSMDIVNGYPDGTFKPDRPLTRAEFLKILVETIKLPSAAGGRAPSEVPFKDVVDHWCRPFIERALNAGIVAAGDYGENFNPDQVIPREEMAYLLLKGSDVYMAQHPEIEFVRKDKVPGFTDSSMIKERYRSAVMECARRGLVEGYPDGTFGPETSLTRAEACAVLSRMLAIQGRHVLLVTPRPGYKWNGSDVFVLGNAAAFEATVNFRVMPQTPQESAPGSSSQPVTGPSSSAGPVAGPAIVPVFENYTTSSNGMGWGAFGICVHRSLITGHGNLVLQIYLVSPKDGSEESLIEVPLNASW